MTWQPLRGRPNVDGGKCDGYVKLSSVWGQSKAQNQTDLAQLTEALDFLVSNLQLHAEEYHHKTDARKVKRCESILEEAISELIARKKRMAEKTNRCEGETRDDGTLIFA